MSEPMIRLDAARCDIAACRTYRFGMRQADRLAHETAPALVAEVERLRDLERAWRYDRQEWAVERDAARAEVQRLRALVEQGVRDEAAALGEAGAAERERDALAARIAAVEALHHPDGHGPGRCDEPDCPTGCAACDDDWPCATVRALTGEEGA